MAYFCLDCWNQLNETNDSKKKYIISRELLLCEGCAMLKNVIIEERKYYYLHSQIQQHEGQFLDADFRFRCVKILGNPSGFPAFLPCEIQKSAV